ncbi:hypothetical protein PIB30_013297 [Stylosanthes scabra]|uniref:Uncharacterized protein n=1 Tax=Stylosanthes scabra TaxID=79078 RepID=A0ABU6S5Y3_9FABA|nr:hypothetical protein [Stylosanthes scabra]
MRAVGIEFFFPKSPSLLQSDDYSSLSHRFILAPFAFLGHFQSDSNLRRHETLEHIKVVDQPTTIQKIDPEEGICFGTLEEAHDYYHRCAEKIDFVVKIRNTN